MADTRKIRYGGTSLIDKMEEAGGISQPVPVPVTPVPKPVTPAPRIFKAGKLYPLTSIMDDETLLRRATKGSKPFSDSEIKQGYRKIGKGLGK